MHLQMIVQYLNVFLCVLCVCLSIRVFLRAINTYADTMNHKFLNNNDFEVQVSLSLTLSQIQIPKSFIGMRHKRLDCHSRWIDKNMKY